MPLSGSALQTFAPQHNGFGSSPEAHSCLPVEHPPAAAPPTPEERRLQRKISNRESARRSRARKLRHLDDLRALAARLRADNRALAARAHAARGRAALARLAGDGLRAEAAALSRRLTLALGQLYAAAAVTGGGGGLGVTPLEQAVASLIA